MKKLAFLALLFSSTALIGEESTPQYTSPTPIAQDRLKTDLTFADQDMPTQRYKSPALAVGLSAIFPGLGHTYLGEYKTAGALAGTTVGSISAARAVDSSQFREAASLSLFTAWSYGLYSSYRDARNYNGRENYSYQMPQDTFADLAYAPFNPKIMKKPEVWGGILGGLAVGIGVGVLSYNVYKSAPVASSAERGPNPLIAFPVGISEEALFRGFLQSSISEVTNPTFGIISSSVLFGAAHYTNTLGMSGIDKKRYLTFSMPYIALSGIYDGWLTYKNKSLKESTAIHAWYDFILFAMVAAASQSVLKEMPRVHYSVTF